MAWQWRSHSPVLRSTAIRRAFTLQLADATSCSSTGSYRTSRQQAQQQPQQQGIGPMHEGWWWHCLGAHTNVWRCEQIQATVGLGCNGADLCSLDALRESFMQPQAFDLRASMSSHVCMHGTRPAGQLLIVLVSHAVKQRVTTGRGPTQSPYTHMHSYLPIAQRSRRPCCYRRPVLQPTRVPAGIPQEVNALAST